MLATPYHSAMHHMDMMSQWSSWEEAAAQEWSAAAAGADAWTQPEPVVQMELERLQQRMLHDLEQWKYLKYHQAGAMHDSFGMAQGEGGWQTAPGDASMPAGLLPQDLLVDHAASDEEGSCEDEVSCSPSQTKPGASPGSASTAASVASQFLDLPAPKRVPLGRSPSGSDWLGSDPSDWLGPDPSGPPWKGDGGEAQKAAGSSDPIGLPPGLLPPGLTFARATSTPVGADEAAADRSSAAASSRSRNPAAGPSGSGAKVEMLGAMTEVSPGVLVGLTKVSGDACTRAEWRIDSVRSKLQASMGRPLVSPPFMAPGLPNLRLMVFPDAREAVRSARSRERKGMYAAMVKKGPLQGSLKLKADCLERSGTVLRFHLTVGGVRRGPFTYDFSECAIHGCDDFGTDWLKQVDDATGNLSVGVEILDEVHGQPPLAISPSSEPPISTTTSEPLICPVQEQGSGDASAGRSGRGKRSSQPRLGRAC